MQANDESPLGVANVRRLYFNDAITSGVDQFLLVALPIYALTSLGLQAKWLGFVMALQYLPALLVAQRVGALVDQSDRRKLMAFGSALGAGVAIVLMVLPRMVSSGTHEALAVLLVAAAGLGLSTLIYQIAASALAPTIVADRTVTELLTGQGSVRTVARMVGMGVAGPLVDVLGGAGSMALLLAVLVARTWVSLYLRVQAAPSTPARADGAASSPSSPNQKGAWQLAFESPALRWGLSGVFVLNVGGGIVGGAYFAYAYELLHLSPTTIGIAMALGAIASVLALRWVKKALKTHSPALICALAGMASGLAPWALPLLPTTQGIAALAFYHVVFGVASTLTVVTFVVMRQRLVDNQVLGRVASTSSTLNAAAMVVGGVAASLLLPRLGAVGTLAVGAALASLACVAWLQLARLGAAGRSVSS